MDENQLLKLSFIVAILGIIALYFLSNVEINYTTIEKINNEKIGNFIKITGRVVDVIETDKITIIKIAQENFIEVVAFDDMEISKGMNVEVSGRVDEYNDKSQIVAEKIIVK